MKKMFVLDNTVVCKMRVQVYAETEDEAREIYAAKNINAENEHLFDFEFDEDAVEVWDIIERGDE